MENNLISRFHSQSLSKAEWTHEAHLTVGLWHIKNHSFEDAVCRLRSGIIQLNYAHGTENNSHSGYHETLTIFWAKVIAFYIKLHVDKSLEEITHNFLQTKLSSRTLPFEFYVKEKILSPEYRSVYKAEELKKLDHSVIEEYLNS